MGKEKEKTPLKKGKAKFELLGRAMVSKYTFDLDSKSKVPGSDWISNYLNLAVNCGGGNIVHSEIRAGYGTERAENFINNVKGKKLKEGTTDQYEDDFKNVFKVNWEDRFNPKILENCGNGSFLRAGIEKDKDGKIFTKRFLSGYDLIAYLAENEELLKDAVIRVRGEIQYSIYNENVQTKKNITSIYLAEDVPESDFKAEFTQTILLDKDSIGRVDKETGLIPIYAKVIDYTKLFNNKEVKTNIPLNKTFYIDNEKLTKIFKVRKGITEVQVIGDIIEGQAKAVLDIKDLPQDIQELIEIGAYTEEAAISSLSIKGEKVNNWIIKKPVIIMKGEEDNKLPVILKTEEKYTEDDLVLDFMIEKDEDIEFPFGEEEPKSKPKSKVKVAKVDEDEDEDEEETLPDEDIDDFLSEL